MNRGTFFENFELLTDAPNGVQKLREIILQSAIQGKIVPQDPNDEPAVVLLEKIKAEKGKLVKEGEIRKGKPSTSIKEEEIPYNLPKEWQWVRLKDLVSLLGDGLHGTPKYSDIGDYFFINGNNLSEGIILIKNNTKRASIDEYNRYKKKLDERTVLVSINGTLGNVAFYNNEKIILGKSACYFNLLHNINKFYLKLLINTSYFLEYAFKNATGSTIKNVSLKTMRLFLVPLPPLREQRRIVAKVDQLMALCDQLEARQQKKHEQRILLNNAALDKLLTTPTPEEFAQHWQRICDNFDLFYDAPETVGQLRQVILQLAVQGKLVAQDPGDEPVAVLLEKIRVEKERMIKENRIKSVKPIPKIQPEELNFQVPDCYEIIRLGECIDLISGQHLGKNEQNDQSEGLAYLTGPSDFGKVNPVAKRWTSHQKAISKKNDILITVKGAGVGKSNILGLEKAAIGRQLMAIRPIVVYQKYVYLVILASYDTFQSLSDGSTVPGIERKDVLHFPLGLPPLGEQKRIVAKVDQLMAFCDELEAGLVQAQTEGGKLMEAVVHHVLAG